MNATKLKQHLNYGSVLPLVVFIAGLLVIYFFSMELFGEGFLAMLASAIIYLVTILIRSSDNVHTTQFNLILENISTFMAFGIASIAFGIIFYSSELSLTLILFVYFFAITTVLSMARNWENDARESVGWPIAFNGVFLPLFYYTYLFYFQSPGNTIFLFYFAIAGILSVSSHKFLWFDEKIIDRTDKYEDEIVLKRIKSRQRKKEEYIEIIKKKNKKKEDEKEIAEKFKNRKKKFNEDEEYDLGDEFENDLDKKSKKEEDFEIDTESEDEEFENDLDKKEEPVKKKKKKDYEITIEDENVEGHKKQKQIEREKRTEDFEPISVKEIEEVFAPNPKNKVSGLTHFMNKVSNISDKVVKFIKREDDFNTIEGMPDRDELEETLTPEKEIEKEKVEEKPTEEKVIEEKKEIIKEESKEKEFEDEDEFENDLDKKEEPVEEKKSDGLVRKIYRSFNKPTEEKEETKESEEEKPKESVGEETKEEEEPKEVEEEKPKQKKEGLLSKAVHFFDKFKKDDFNTIKNMPDEKELEETLMPKEETKEVEEKPTEKKVEPIIEEKKEEVKKEGLLSKVVHFFDKFKKDDFNTIKNMPDEKELEETLMPEEEKSTEEKVEPILEEKKEEAKKESEVKQKPIEKVQEEQKQTIDFAGEEYELGEFEDDYSEK